MTRKAVENMTFQFVMLFSKRGNHYILMLVLALNYL